MEPDVTNSEVDRIRICADVFRRATESLHRLQGRISDPLFEASSVGDTRAFRVLNEGNNAIDDARPFVRMAHSALVKYGKEMEQVQVQFQNPGLVVTYSHYLGHALREAAHIDLKALQASATAVGFDAAAFRAISEAVERARYYESHGDI